MKMRLSLQYFYDSPLTPEITQAMCIFDNWNTMGLTLLTQTVRGHHEQLGISVEILKVVFRLQLYSCMLIVFLDTFEYSCSMSGC